MKLLTMEIKMKYILKILSYSFLLTGFVWIIYIVLMMETSNKDYSLMIFHIKNLPDKELITRKAAASEIRGFQLDICHTIHTLIMPAILMLVGGILNGLKIRKN